MNTDAAISFIKNYDSGSRECICFAWNRKHGAEFVDGNDPFRQQVIAAVLAEPAKAGLDLIADLFEAEARWSKEAWCVRDSFSTLGTILLRRGGTDRLDHFLEWFTVSFDAYSACHAMRLDPVMLAPLIAEVDRRVVAATDAEQKDRLELAHQLFAKHKAGNPLKGMVKLEPSDLGNVKVMGPVALFCSRVKQLLRKR